MEKIILSIDCGTQSLRCLLFNARGELLEKTKVEYAPYFSVKPGWAEQDPEVFWKSACQACRALKDRRGDLVRSVSGVGVTTQRDSMVNVDENGKPLRPVITWLDQRKAKKVYFPRGIRKLIYKTVGMEEAIDKAQTDGKCNWIRQYQPDVWERTYKYLQVSGFLNFRLTGLFKDSVASQIGHLPMDYKRMRWSKPGALAAKLFAVEPTKLPELVAPGQLIGTLTDIASSETGLPEGLPVIACGSDKGCETIGVGVIDERAASLSFGTTATVQTTSNRYFEPLRFMPPYPAAIPGHYNPEVEIFRGYWMITWFKKEFAHQEVEQARIRGVPPEAVLDELLATVPPGSMGLLVQPFWGPGLKHPAAKGAIIGFGAVHRKAHLYRAVIEGLGYALLDGLLTMQERGRFRAERVAVSGGASQSDEICRITADIFDLPLTRGATHETSGLGAAIVASVGLGIHPTFEAAIERMVTHDTVFEPDPRNVATYRKLYERVYRKMYDSFAPLYDEIRDIVDYPEKV